MPAFFKKNSKKNQAGFGIIEAMASIGIMVTATLGFIACYRFSINSFSEIKQRAAAVELLNNVVETFRFRGQADFVIYDSMGNLVKDWSIVYDQNGNMNQGFFQVWPFADSDTYSYNLAGFFIR